MFTTSPAQALDLILHGPGKTANPNFILLDYRDPATFSALWLHGLESGKVTIGDQSKIDLTDSTKQFLLIGNDPPDGIFDTKIPALAGINFRSHFTATSWLAACKVKFPDSKVCIAVIDPRESRHAQGTVRALQEILGAKDNSGQSFIPGAAVINGPSLETICKWLNSAKSEERTISQDSSHLLELLKSTIWNELTSDRDQHHALSNVLGAFLLASQAGKGVSHVGDSSVQDYMLALVQALGVEANLDQVKLKEHGGFQRWINTRQQKEIEGVVLIDDMADLWSFFLRGATGFASDVEFDQPSGRTYQQSLEVFGRDGFAEEISTLPGRLKRFFASNRPNLSASDLLDNNTKLEENFVLFLDLRLFSSDRDGKPGEAEMAFLRQLQDFGNVLLDSKRNLPWVSAEECAAIKKELAHWANDTMAGEQLKMPPRETLLPRLIALLDPTLPIVLFSSTHRTELIEPFRSFANIITDFHKPVLSGLTSDWQEVVKQLHASLGSAIDRARRILQARRSFQIVRAKSSGCTSILPPSDNGHLVEFFLDESEENTTVQPPRAVCAGGILMVRALDGRGDPVISDQAIFDHLRSKRCLWGWCSDTPANFQRPQGTPQQPGFLKKGNDLNFSDQGNGAALMETMISETQGALGSMGLVLPVASIDLRSQPIPEWMVQPHGVSPWAVEKILDATLRRLMQHLVESLLFRSELLRPALTSSKSRVAIDFGIRDYPCQPNRALYENFGFEVRNNWRPSLHAEDGFLMTAETIARCGIPWPYPSRIERARAVPLRDFGTNPTRPNGILPKQMHYFADTIAHVALDDLTDAKSRSAKVCEFFEAGWISDFRRDKEEPSRLEIGRAWDQGDRLPALCWAAKLRNYNAPNGIGVDVFREISMGASQLNGQELRRLFDLAQ